MRDRLSVQIINRKSQIKVLRDAFDEFGRANSLSDKVFYDVHLALDELLTNIISYGYDNSKEHIIRVHFHLDSVRLEVEIVDDSRPYNILKKKDPITDLPLERKPVGGLGILLVKKLMTRIDYSYREGKNHLVLTKNLESQKEKRWK